MNISSTPRLRPALSACGGLVMACLVAGCQPKTEPKPPPAAADLGEIARRLIDPNYAVGALVLGKNGEIVAVDATGTVVPPCALPGERPADPPNPVGAPAKPEGDVAKPEGDLARVAAGEDPECAKVRNTTIINLQSTGIVRHTGSTCTTVGPIIHAGKARYFQVPVGCK